MIMSFTVLYLVMIPLTVNMPYLKSLAYNSFVTDNSRHMICSSDIDPDTNYLNSISNITSKYLAKSEFIAFIATSF